MTDHEDISIHYFEEKIKFNDLLVVVTHPTIGTISSIVGNYLIENLDLRLIGAFISPDLPPTAIIRHGEPLPPVRIYAGEYKDDPDTAFDQLVVIASDLPMERTMMYPLADRILEWAEFNKAKAVLTIEGINREELTFDDDVSVYHVISTPSISEQLEDIDTQKFSNGMVTGLSGLLLYKGKVAKYPVISLLADAHEKFPDSRSAAAVLSVLNKLLPKIEIDYDPLLKQAEKVEEQIRMALSQIKQSNIPRKTDVPQGMYA